MQQKQNNLLGKQNTGIIAPHILCYIQSGPTSKPQPNDKKCIKSY